MAGNLSTKFNLPFFIGLPDAVPADLAQKDPQVAALLDQIYNAFQQMQLAMHAYLGIGQQLQALWPQLQFDQTMHIFSPSRLYVKATEALTLGSVVNIFDSAGTLSAQKANATNNTKPAHGFCTTLSGIAIGSYGECILNHGLLSGVSGLVRGTRYFLSTTGGLVTAVAPVAAGNIEQALGVALSTTALLYNIPFTFVQH